MQSCKNVYIKIYLSVHPLSIIRPYQSGHNENNNNLLLLCHFAIQSQYNVSVVGSQVLLITGTSLTDHQQMNLFKSSGFGSLLVCRKDKSNDCNIRGTLGTSDKTLKTADNFLRRETHPNLHLFTRCFHIFYQTQHYSKRTSALSLHM